MLGERYLLEERLGRSGTGMVWRARDTLLGRAVAVRIINPTLADDPAFAARLSEEARRVASISSPSLAGLLDSDEEDGVPYLVREHIEGVSARERLEREGPLGVAEAVGIAASVLDALDAAHASGVLHLDLELDDVLLGEDGSVRVTDLGVGAAVSATRPPEAASALLGEENLAPEQRGDGVVDERTDLFAVGALLFELLTGRTTAEAGVSVRGVRPDVPRRVDRAISRALSPRREDRFGSARAFASVLAAPGATDLDGQPAGEGSRGVLRTWVGVPIAVAVCAAAAIALGLWFGRLEVGGPLGIRTSNEAADPSPSLPAVRNLPATVSAFDPFGDGSENSSTAPAAGDGDRATAWRSENYFDGELHKPGMGIVLDLGSSRPVSRIRLWTPHPGYTFHLAIGEDADALVGAVGDPITAEADTRVAVAGTGRYVLVWITSVVDAGDGNRAEVSEIRVSGPSDV